MKLTVKLYASLGQYLPDEAKNNVTELEIEEDNSAEDVIRHFAIPEESAHLVLVNGIYVNPNDRSHNRFNEGDVLAIWPPVAGG